MNNFENKIELLKEKRSKLNQSNSFDEISVLMKEIRELYTECTLILEDVSSKLANLEASTRVLQPLDNMKFSQAMDKMYELSEEIKTISVSSFPELIARMYALKAFCFDKLDKEKINMEEFNEN